MKAQIIRKTGLVLATGVIALGAWMAQAANDTGYGSAPPLPAAPLPSRVADVLKLNQAKVSDGTIIAYVQNSGNTYHLDASQIISLRDQGVSDGVITAMLSAGITPENGQMSNDQTPDTNPPPPPDVNSNGDTTSGTQPTVIYVNSAPVYYYPAWSFSWWWPVGVTWGWAWWGGCWHWGCHNGGGFHSCGFWNHGFHGSSGFHAGFAHGFNHGFNQGFAHGFNTAHGFNSFHTANGFHGNISGNFATANGFHGNISGNFAGVNGFHTMSSASVVHFGGMNGGSFHGMSSGSVMHFGSMSSGGGMHFGGMGGGGGHGGGGFGGGHGR